MLFIDYLKDSDVRREDESYLILDGEGSFPIGEGLRWTLPGGGLLTVETAEGEPSVVTLARKGQEIHRQEFLEDHGRLTPVVLREVSHLLAVHDATRGDDEVLERWCALQDSLV